MLARILPSKWSTLNELIKRKYEKYEQILRIIKNDIS